MRPEMGVFPEAARWNCVVASSARNDIADVRDEQVRLTQRSPVGQLPMDLPDAFLQAHRAALGDT